MSSGTTLKKKTNSKGAIERVEDLEQNFQGVIQALNHLIMQSNARFNNITEVLGGIAALVGGPEKIEEAVGEFRRQQAEQQRLAAEASLKQQVDAGLLVPAEQMSEKTYLIVGTEFNADGSVANQRVQAPFVEVVPDVRGKLLGLGVGGRAQTAAGTTFEVSEIYERGAPKQEPVAPEQSDAQTAAEG